MAESQKHVLAAFGGQGEPIAYLSSSLSWTHSPNEAACFESQHEADDHLRANARGDNPGPVRSVCLSQNETNTAANEQAEPTRLYTGIYG